MSALPISEEAARAAAVANYEAGRKAVERVHGEGYPRHKRFGELGEETQDGLCVVVAEGIQAFLQAEGFEVEYSGAAWDEVTEEHDRGAPRKTVAQADQDREALLGDAEPRFECSAVEARLIGPWKPAPTTEGER